MDDKGTIFPGDVVDAIQREAAEGDEEMRLLSRRLEPLSGLDLAEVRGMNRAQRRAWYSNRRRKNKRFGGTVR